MIWSLIVISTVGVIACVVAYKVGFETSRAAIQYFNHKSIQQAHAEWESTKFEVPPFQDIIKGYYAASDDHTNVVMTIQYPDIAKIIKESEES